jgi:tellurite resistance protein TerC
VRLDESALDNNFYSDLSRTLHELKPCAMAPLIFPFSTYYWFYGVFIAFILGLLALDLFALHKKDSEPTFASSLRATCAWISLALAFNVFLYFFTVSHFSEGLIDQSTYSSTVSPHELAMDVSLQFLAGFILEKALAFDNMFVFYVLFKFFAIPRALQHRVLYYGILGALFFRSILIAFGSILVSYFWANVIFGLFLVCTGVKIFSDGPDIIDPSNNKVLALLRRKLPISTHLDGNRFFTREDAVRKVTPLFVALVFVEVSDIVFAVDSVPAVFALTKEPFIVFTSNIFAILGLRALYFMLISVVDKFHLLRFGLGAVLVFVGSKMALLNELFGGYFPILVSLSVILLLIGGSIVASLYIAPKAPPSTLLTDSTPKTPSVK